jgi:hypothetical protein
VLRVLKLLLLSYILSIRYNASGYRESSKLLLYKSISYELLYRVRFITLRSPSLKLFISYIFLNSVMSFYKERGFLFFDFLSYLFPLT